MTLNNPQTSQATEAEIRRSEIDKVTSKILAEKNLDFRLYKQSFLSRRLARRLRFSKTRNIDDYLEKITNDSSEYQRLLKDLVIQVSEFFRDGQVFSFLDTVVIPRIIEDTRNKGSDTIKVWCPGCATGEEVFSVAILFLEHLQIQPYEFKLLIYGTDISKKALEVARQTSYSAEKLANVSEELRKKYFTRVDDRFKLICQVKDKVKLGFHDLVLNPPINHLNLLICRNVCIYLERELQSEIFEKFAYALEKDGFLLLGQAESLTENACFNFHSFEKSLRVFQKI